MKTIKNIAWILFCSILISCNSRGNEVNEPYSYPFRPQEKLCAAATTDIAWYSSGKKAPKFEGLDGVNFKISSKNEESQIYFNQGMMLAYGFNHAEAARSFYESIRQDSSCGICYWGFAYVLGPNYNAGMEPDNYERAYRAMKLALDNSNNASSKEKALILAIQKRYADPMPEDPSELNEAYAKEMEKVRNMFPEDADIAALYAESRMDQHPWDLWEKNGTAKSWTPGIIKVLEDGLKKFPEHAGLNHFYIHAIEASATPEKGLPSADFLRNKVPAAGHLVHMPSHIYIRTGKYHEGSIANIKAAEVDAAYVAACNAQGAYPLAYYPHVWHFLAATATLEGNSKLAMEAALKVASNTDKKVMREEGWSTLQHYYTIPWFIAAKFELWDEIRKIPKPEKDLLYPLCIQSYATGLADLAEGDLAKAEAALAFIEKLGKDSSLAEMSIWGLNPITDVIEIARLSLGAEIMLARSDYMNAKGMAEQAIAIEDKLNYDEPPDWFFSVRHLLGKILLKAGKFTDAEKIYKQDLQNLPLNPWAYAGLNTALKAQNKTTEATEISAKLKNALVHADDNGIRSINKKY